MISLYDKTLKGRLFGVGVDLNPDGSLGRINLKDP